MEGLRAVLYRREALDVDGVEAEGSAPDVELEVRHDIGGRVFGRSEVKLCRRSREHISDFHGRIM